MRLLLSIVGCVLLIAVAAAFQSADPPRSSQQLEMLLTQFDEELAGGRNVDDESLRAVRRQIDRVAAQKDAHQSRLYWHTNLGDALSEARAMNRPVLSLRLLGRLDEEMSCANSRFFRAILYSDPSISSLLRDKFVLHWESLRPVPVITVDFGDGRSFKRTITGNSIHYVLAPDGQIIDALPGLIAPRVFERELVEVLKLAQSSLDASIVRDYHQRKLERLPAMTFEPSELALPQQTLERMLAAMPLTAVTLNRPNAQDAGAKTFSKIQVERPLLRLARNPMPALPADTQLNMTQLRPAILRWLIESPGVDLKSLNDRVYRELFLTPLDDPWMGLDVPEAYSGLPSVR